MKLMIIVISILIVGNNSTLFSQRDKTELEVYNSSDNTFIIKYPENWNIENNNEEVISIEPKEMRGGIYISKHNNITFPDEDIKDFILESNQLPKEATSDIIFGEENGIKSWYISYTDTVNNLICMSAYKRKGSYLLFVSTEIEPNQWENGWKEIIIEIISSITLK